MEGGMKCVKLSFYVLLLVFCICAMVLITVGLVVQPALSGTVTSGATSGSLLPVIIIGVGAFLLLVALLGCWGAYKENYYLMITFAIFLSLIMVVEVALAITGYIFKDNGRAEFDKDFRQQMNNYSKNNGTAAFLDKLQIHFECCGAANYLDWENIPGMGKNWVPDSCCVNITPGCGTDFKPNSIHTDSCVEKIGNWLRKKVLLVAAAALGIAFVEILGIVFVCCLVKNIRRDYEMM